MRLLVVEDEHRIAEALKRGLTQEGYAVDVRYSGDEGYELAASENYDLLILDIMLPKMDGLEITRQLRSENIHTPILLLTARTQVKDRVKGLDTGADDYLPKPFAFEELLARVRALLRRPMTEVSTVLENGVIRVDTNTKQVTVKGKNTLLTAKEYALLEYLLRQKGHTVTKDQVINHVWDYDADVLPNTVEAYVKRLRKKIGEEQIMTLRGFGYKMGDN